MMHPWHLHGMPMRVVARDGYPLGPAAFTCDTLGVNPGERWDVVIECDEPGAWAFHCHILPHAEGQDGMFGMVTALVVQEPSAVRAAAGRESGRDRRSGGRLDGADLPDPGHRLMRLVTAGEAVAGIGSGEQVYVHCAAATPSVLLDALVARAAELRDVGMVHLHMRGPGAAPGARDGRSLPSPGAVHRAQRAAGRERGSRGLRAGLPVRRPAAVRLRRAAARRGASSTRRRPTPTGSARSGRPSRRCTPRSGPRRP